MSKSEAKAIEFHDSTLRAIRWAGVDAILKMRVYIHASEGQPGCDAGRGWYQDAEMVLADARIEQRPTTDLRITDGTIRVDGRPFDNLLPLPCEMSGAVEIAFSGHEGALTASARAIHVALKGSPGEVEVFRP